MIEKSVVFKYSEGRYSQIRILTSQTKDPNVVEYKTNKFINGEYSNGGVRVCLNRNKSRTATSSSLTLFKLKLFKSLVTLGI